MSKKAMSWASVSLAALALSVAPLTPVAAAVPSAASVHVSIGVPAERCVLGICIRGKVKVATRSKSSVLAYFNRNAQNKPIGNYKVMKPGTKSDSKLDVDTVSVPTDYWNRGYRLYFKPSAASGTMIKSKSRNVNISDGSYYEVWVAK